MTQSVVENTVSWLNAFAAKDGVSKTLSPAAIILGTPNPDCKNLKITFGSYAQVYESTTNTTKARSIGAIALKPSNERGGYYFMSLSTGKRLHCYQWTELPVPDYVIDRVEDMAAQEDQPIMTNGYPIFEWSPGVPILNEDETEGEEHEEAELENEDIMYGDDTDDELSVDEDDAYYVANDEVNEVSADDGEADETGNEQEPNSEDESAVDDDQTVETVHDEVDEDGDAVPADDVEDDVPALENAQNEGASTNDEQRSDGRPRRSQQARQRQHYAPSFEGKTYETQFFGVTQKQEEQPSMDECHRIAVNVMFAQMSAAKGIKLFGERAVAAMFKEYNQLHDMSVFGKVDPDTLTHEQKKKALRAINLIKEKRCGKIKGRTVADGRPQRDYIPREEATSPTVSTESLMASLVIDAFEGRDVAIFDIPGAYLNADMPDDKFVLLKLEGEFVHVMCEVNPEYKEDVRQEHGKPVLYLRVLKALYGCIESALLWYEMFSSTLKGMGFVINPYDKCVANKDIDGKQCTIVWYVDDNKLSHDDDKVVTRIIEDIRSDYGDLVISRGKEHTFLGMNIKFKDDRSVQIGMKDYITESIELFGEDVSKNVATPATKNLFVVDPDAESLDRAKADIFHSIVAKLLWVMKRSRPDIETTISFLCTRVSCSDIDDWKKLRRLLQFLSQTIDDERVIGADDLSQLATFVEGSYAIHHDMKSHTGGAMSFGTGIVHGKASKQKLNTKSSTETEVVAASDYLPYNIWLRHFMEAQGYPLVTNIFHQDNQSAMKMEKNGRNSCTGNSRHIHIRHFFIKDQVDAKHLEIVYCPTEEMLADYFTKPLQGRLFHKFREVIMGWKHISSLKDPVPSPSKERVGDMDESSTVEETVEEPPRTYAQALKGLLKPPRTYAQASKGRSRPSVSFEEKPIDRE
jgi:KUP system potassium uptake protein